MDALRFIEAGRMYRLVETSMGQRLKAKAFSLRNNFYIDISREFS